LGILARLSPIFDHFMAFFGTFREFLYWAISLFSGVFSPGRGESVWDWGFGYGAFDCVCGARYFISFISRAHPYRDICIGRWKQCSKNNRIF
jgi:hypothetical protein